MRKGEPQCLKKDRISLTMVERRVWWGRPISNRWTTAGSNYDNGDPESPLLFDLMGIIIIALRFYNKLVFFILY